MKIVEVRHPLVQHKIGLMRNAALSTKDFRELANELGTLLAYEATADLDTEPHTLPGWAGPVTVQRIAERQDHRGADPARRPGHAQWRAVADPGCPCQRGGPAAR